jgi:hypothetical protein
MFGFGLEGDEWAAVLGTAFLALRLLFALVRVVWLYARDCGPPRGPTVYTLLGSGVAVGALAVGAVSIWTGGLPAAARQLGYSFAAVLGFFLGMMFDLVIEMRAARLWVWLMAFRVPRYREELQSPDSEARLAAVNKLLPLGQYARPAVPELLDAFKDSSADVRAAAAHGVLNLIPDPPEGDEAGTTTAARSAMSDSDVRVRAIAAAILVRFNAATPAEVLPALCAGLARTTEPCAGDAADALCHIGPPAAPAVGPLRDLALSPDAPGSAATALGKIGEPAIPALVEILEKGEPAAQYLAALALGDMGEPARVALPALRRLSLLTTNYANVAAKKAITKLGGDIK